MSAGGLLRILIPTLGFGRAGGNRVLSRLATEWCRGGHEVVFASPDTSKPPYFPTEAAIAWLDPRGRAAEGPRGEGETGAGNLRSLLGGMRRLQDGFDIVLANHSLTTWPVLLAGVPRCKRFYYIQAYEAEYYAAARQPLNRIASALSYRLPFTQIVNATGYPGLAGRPFVPFGIDLDLFYPVLPTDARGPRPLVVGTIGRTEPGKGTRFVLEAFRQLRRDWPDARLRVAYGNLPEGTDLTGLDIVFPHNDAQLADFYRGIDVLVAGTYGQDGAPHYPVLEAMACGIPVVNTGYLPATSDSAWIARPCDPASLVEQVRHIMAYPAETERKRARALEAVRPFAWDAVARQMMEVFQQC